MADQTEHNNREETPDPQARASGPEDAIIVDEATAALDPETDEQVHQAICRIMQGRTCIFIVHRLQMARTADRILVLHEGRLHEAGSHLQLLHTAGTLYRTLYAQQYGHDLLPAIREGRP